MQPGRDPFSLRDLGDGPAGQLVQPATAGDGVLGREGRGAAYEGHVEHDAPPIDVFERPVFAPFRKRQRSRPTIGFAHRLDVLAGVGKKACPFFGVITRRCALDAEQADQLLAVLLLAFATERARGAFEIGRQIGNAGLDHRIDDPFRHQEGKPEGGVIPDGGVEARVPRGKGRAAIRRRRGDRPARIGHAGRSPFPAARSAKPCRHAGRC